MLFAALVLGTMIIWMAKNTNIREQIENQAADALESNNAGWGIFALAFIAVFREGVEIILFLYSIMISTNGISISSSLAGSILGILIGYLIFVKGRNMPLKAFFNITSIILIFVASGMVAYGVHELEEAEIIPYDQYCFEESYFCNGQIWDINPELTIEQKEFNATISDELKYKRIYPMLHEKGKIGVLMKGFFGYNGNPSLVEVIFYLSTLITLFNLWIRIKKNNEAVNSQD